MEEAGINNSNNHVSNNIPVEFVPNARVYNDGIFFSDTPSNPSCKHTCLHALPIHPPPTHNRVRVLKAFHKPEARALCLRQRKRGHILL